MRNKQHFADALFTCKFTCTPECFWFLQGDIIENVLEPLLYLVNIMYMTLAKLNHYNYSYFLYFVNFVIISFCSVCYCYSLGATVTT